MHNTVLEPNYKETDEFHKVRKYEKGKSRPSEGNISK